MAFRGVSRSKLLYSYLLTYSGFLKFPFILEKKIIFFKVNLHKHYLSLEICFCLELQEGMKQRPKGAALPQASSQFLFLLFLGDDLRLLPWALRWGIRLALLKIYHKFFSPTSWPVFSPTFSAPFSTSFSAAFVASFLQFCLSTCDDFPKYIAKSLTDNFPCVRISFSSFNFHF